MRGALIAALLAAGCAKDNKDTTPVSDPGPAVHNVAEPAPVRAEPAAGWTRYRSEAGGFEIDFPGTPAEQNQMMETDSGPVLLHMVVLDLGTSALLVSWQIQPAAAPTDPTTVLDGQRDGMMGAFPGATLLEQADITIGAHPGRWMIVKLVQPDATQYSRVYLADGKLFQLAAMTSGNGDPVAAAQFLDTFTLLAK
jgi:hypothetical protein